MNVRYRSQFKKDYRLMIKQSRDIYALDYVIDELSMPHPLDASYFDHPLKGEYAMYRECHIESDWLLVYGDETLDGGECQLLCVRTGTHSELFE